LILPPRTGGRVFRSHMDTDSVNIRTIYDIYCWTQCGSINTLQKLKGIIIGKLCSYQSFDEHRKAMLSVVNENYGLNNLPIVANMNFGHTSPICILPYGAMAEIDCDNKNSSIVESGVE